MYVSVIDNELLQVAQEEEVVYTLETTRYRGGAYCVYVREEVERRSVAGVG